MNRKSSSFTKIITLALFTIYVFLCFWGTNIKELQGDEASSILAILPALKLHQGLKGLGSIFLFGHAPLRAIVEIPFLLLFGLKEFWLYLPNVLATIFIFFVLRKTLQEVDKNSELIGLALLIFNGVIVISRMVIGVGFYIFFTLFFLYYFYLFLKDSKKKNLKLSLIFLILSILTYSEALLFIPALLFWLFKRKKMTQKFIKKYLLYFFTTLAFFFFVWIAGPIIALKLSLIKNLKDFGFFRIIARSSGFNLPSPRIILQSYTLYNSGIYILLLTIGAAFSFLEKKSYFFWSFLTLPLFYFSLVKNPTNHPSHYFAILILISSLGFTRTIQHLKNKKIFKVFLVLTFISIMLHNFLFLKKEFYTLNSCFICGGWGRLNHLGLKAVALKIQKDTSLCDKIYTDIEGHVFRLYFGRRPTDNSQEVQRKFLKKDLSNKINKVSEKKYDENYSSFQKLLPYLDCP